MILFIWPKHKNSFTLVLNGHENKHCSNEHHYLGQACFSVLECVCSLRALMFESLLLPQNNHLHMLMFLHMPELYCVCVGRQFHVRGIPPTFLHLHCFYIITSMLCPRKQKPNIIIIYFSKATSNAFTCLWWEKQKLLCYCFQQLRSSRDFNIAEQRYWMTWTAAGEICGINTPLC